MHKKDHIIIGYLDFDDYMLFTAVWNILVTSSFVLQFIIWIGLFQFYFTTTNVGIISTKKNFESSGHESASIL